MVDLTNIAFSVFIKVECISTYYFCEHVVNVNQHFAKHFFRLKKSKLHGEVDKEHCNLKINLTGTDMNPSTRVLRESTTEGWVYQERLRITNCDLHGVTVKSRVYTYAVTQIRRYSCTGTYFTPTRMGFDNIYNRKCGLISDNTHAVILYIVHCRHETAGHSSHAREQHG